jgi:hypothetical protein
MMYVDARRRQQALTMSLPKEHAEFLVAKLEQLLGIG